MNDDPETGQRHEDQCPVATVRCKTRDVRYRYRGYWTEGGVCRIRIYEAEGETPVVVATELPENTNTSITNVTEYLAAEVLARWLPHRLEDSEPAIWIEEYPPREPEDEGDRYSRVTFASYTPRVKWCGGVRRIALGEPSWRHITAADIVQLIGHER